MARQRRLLRPHLFRLLALGGLGGLAWMALRADRRRPLPRPGEAGSEGLRRAVGERSGVAAGGPWRALSAGEGDPTVVLLHGLGGRPEHYRALLEDDALAGRWLAPELPGHGRAAIGRGEDGWVTTVGGLQAMLFALGVERALLCGHGLAAFLALELAARCPERVAALALLDPFADPQRLPADELAVLRAACERDARGELHAMTGQLLASAPFEVRDEVLADLAATPEPTLRSLLLAALDGEPQERLARLSLPIVLLSTDPEDLPASLVAGNPGLPRCRLATAGHWPMLTAPRALARCLLDFADRSMRGAA